MIVSVLGRSDRDSNSGIGFADYTLSRRASSATRASLLADLSCKGSDFFLFMGFFASFFVFLAVLSMFFLFLQ